MLLLRARHASEARALLLQRGWNLRMRRRPNVSPPAQSRSFSVATTRTRRSKEQARDLGEFDYVIVGGGSAGCVLANRLSADLKTRVALLEAGADDQYHWIHIPVGYVYTMRYPQHRTNWGFETTSQRGLGGRKIFYPRGKVLGGSGAINGMIAMRGQPQDFDGWAALTQDDSWSWRRMRPHFERQMAYTAADPTLPDGTSLGTEGPLMVTKQVSSWAVLEEWAKACMKMGLPRRTHFIDSATEGVGLFEVTQTHALPGRGGVRLSPYRAFLAPVLSQRPNLTIVTNAHAKKLVIEDLRATGVELWLREPRGTAFEYARAVLVDLGIVKGRPDCVVQKQQDELCRIKATKEVIVAAGAVGSPHLLQCSGVGPRALLETARVETVVDLPGVGGNLQDHLQIRAVFKLEKSVDTLNGRMNSWFGMARTVLEYVFYQSGPMAMAPSQLGVFAASSSPTPNLQWHVQPLSLDSWEEPLHRWPGLTASVCNIRPTSRGSVELTSPDTRDPPRIDPNYLDTQDDRDKAAAGLRLTREMASLLDPALAPEEYLPGTQYVTTEELAEAAGRIGTSIFHPAGTTAMGRDGDPMAVLNSKLQVRDGTHGGVIAGLRVADCGAMPTITSGNTNLPTYAIAEKCARMILGEEDDDDSPPQ